MKGGNAYETFLERMRPHAERLAEKRCTAHPYLGQEDLVQEGMFALCQLWEKNHQRLPLDDLCRVGHLAMLRQMQDEHRRAYGPAYLRRHSYGEGAVVWADLDQGVAEVRPAYHLEATFLLLGLQEVGATLSDAGRAVLDELLAPGVKTLGAVRRLWEVRLRRKEIRLPQVKALSNGLRMAVPAVRMALREVRQAVAHLFDNIHRRGDRYSKVGQLTLGHVARAKEVTMGHKKEIMPDAPDPLALGELETPQPPEEPKTRSRAAKAQEETAAPPETKPGGKKMKTKVKAKTNSKGRKNGARVFPKSKTGKHTTMTALVLDMLTTGKGATITQVTSALAKEFPTVAETARAKAVRILLHQIDVVEKFRYAKGHEYKEDDTKLVKINSR